MKRKFLVILLALASALCLVFGLSACSRLLGGSHGGSGGGSEIEEGGSGGEHTHHFVYVYNNDATCTADGTETEHCDSCDATGETRVKEGTKLGHDMVQLPARGATCAESGYTAHIGCSRCGYTEETVEYTDDALHVQYELSDDHYIVSDLDSACTDTEIEIPATYKGLPVTEIEQYAFYGCSSLTSVTIPASVTSIGGSAFSSCSSLQSVTFEGESKLTSIGSSAFNGCSSLTSITIPASVTSIGGQAFYKCSSLEAVYITDLEAWCGIDFDDSSANPLYYAQLYVDGERVTDLHIPDGVTEIKNYAFEGGAFTSVTIPAGVTSIGEHAFSGCSSLQSITIPESVTSIGYVAFSGCSSLQSVTFEGDSQLTSIGYQAFYNCRSLNAVYITDLKAWCGIDFGVGGYYYANPLNYAHHLYVDGQEVTDLHIPDSITEIKPDAFGGGAFRRVTIPAGVTSIGDSAFYNCSSLNAVYITDLEAWCGIDFGDKEANPLYYAQLYVDGERVTDLHIPDGVTEIKPYAFYGGAFRSVTIPAGVTSIGQYAFYDCDLLSSITIPESVTSIGNCAFYNCSSLTSITIPASVTSIGSSAFNGCHSLQRVTFEGDSQLTLIGGYAFSDCSSLQTVTFAGDSLLTSIGDSAFSGCSSLTSITIPESVTSIGSFAFSGCSSLTSVTIPAGVTSIEGSALRGCSSLQSITIPARVTSIGDSAFYNCSSLQSIAIPERVTSIGEGAFYNCSSLEAVYITDLEAWCGIDFDGYHGHDYANPLYYAHHLYVDGEGAKDLHIPDGVTEIKPYAFYGGAFTSVTIPASVTSIGEYAFSDCGKLIEVWNYSQLPIKKGEWSNYGAVAHYAKHVYTANEQSKQTVTEDGYIFYEDGNEVYLLDYKGNETSLTLPAASPSGKDYAIYKYAFCKQYAFYKCDSLTSVTIPEGVTSIGQDAFSGCSSLESVTFEGDSQLTLIGGYAFYGCSSLASITIPASVTSIGDSAFNGCSSLENITIPASVTEIGWSAFYNCSSLQSVRFERTDGWKISTYSDMRYAKDVTVSDPQTAAEYLTNTYHSYCWKRY